jgi:hypothetical protein
MHEHLPSECHWTLDPFLRRYFLSAGVVAGVCLVSGILFNIIPLDEAMIALPLRIAGGLVLGVTGAVSALFVWIGMLSYWWQVDRRERGMNAFWLLALSAGNWAGAVVYYFVVFRKIADQRSGGHSR